MLLNISDRINKDREVWIIIFFVISYRELIDYFK